MRVEPADVTADWAVLSLVGPSSVEALARLGRPVAGAAALAPVPRRSSPPAPWPPRPTSRYDAAALPGGGYARRMTYGVDLLVPRGQRWPTWSRRSACRWPGLWAFEALRVADRRPRLGLDTDHRTLPAEVGWLADAVHLDKGCYRGQETVARVHHLGRPPRRLVLLHLDGITTDELPAPGHAGDHRGRPARSASSAPPSATTSWARSRWPWSSRTSRTTPRCASAPPPPPSTRLRLPLELIRSSIYEQSAHDGPIMVLPA